MCFFSNQISVLYNLKHPLNNCMTHGSHWRSCPCARDEIGRRARLRIWCFATCRFESYRAHKKERRVSPDLLIIMVWSPRLSLLSIQPWHKQYWGIARILNQPPPSLPLSKLDDEAYIHASTNQSDVFVPLLVFPCYR